MLYLPDASYLPRFQQLAYPLPPKFMSWIYSRGLGIYVLPEDKQAALDLLARVVDTPVTEDTIMSGDSRAIYDTAHFRYPEKLIIIPHSSFYQQYGENVLIHELGHAVDFLYSDGENSILSSQPYIWKALRVKKLLNKYCADKFKQSGLMLEQFACSFCAFFQEPDKELLGQVSTIDNLSPELVSFFNKNIMEHFQ
jgi:hypothetical protein